MHDDRINIAFAIAGPVDHRLKNRTPIIRRGGAGLCILANDRMSARMRPCFDLAPLIGDRQIDLCLTASGNAQIWSDAKVGLHGAAGAASRVLRRLWDYREELRTETGLGEWAAASVKKSFDLIERLELGAPRTDGIDRFSQDTTLDELVSAIERDIKADKPEVALDRLHTYCMKKFAHLLRSRGDDVRSSETLNARAGRYFSPIRRSGKVRPISETIMKSTVETFELFNNIRNNESLAHDNILVENAEARFIFDGVVNLMRFLKSIEGRNFE